MVVVRMITQHYKMPATPDMFEHASSGQLVYVDENMEIVGGFIDFISDSHLCVMLFEPKEIPYPNVINIQTVYEDNTIIYARLKEIMDNDPEIAEMWEKLIYEDLQNDE